MRARIESLRLLGTSRVVRFDRGLNIITGPIASGKTTLLELCRGLLGSSLRRFQPEVTETTTAIAGEIMIGDHEYSVVRPLTTSEDAHVDLSGADVAERLPVHRPVNNSNTYGKWLLERLDLPRIEVPRAPTQPDSESTPVTIRDYMNYCVLTQDEIDSSVLGNTDPFKNIKRKYVFEILYGLYGIETAKLQDDLREIAARIRALRADEGTLQRLLADTPWENRASLERNLNEAKEGLRQARSEAKSVARQATHATGTQRLRRALIHLDERVNQVEGELAREQLTEERLTELEKQLSGQSARIVRSIVADKMLLDFEFLRCPRCGAGIDAGRADRDKCPLCLQEPQPTYSRKDLVLEQGRLEAQVDETRELIEAHKQKAKALEKELERAKRDRDDLADKLDRATGSYVSDAADRIAANADRMARLEATVEKLQEYLGLFAKLDNARRELATLERERSEIESRLQADEGNRGDAWRRVEVLEKRFGAILSRLHAPEIGQEEGGTRIDRVTYLPFIRGRSFDGLSSLGLKVLVNVAHVVAHHETSLELGLGLPGILIIDGPSSNIGREGEDEERIRSIYRYLVEVSGRLGNDLQILVADTDVPSEAQPFVRIAFSENDRLVPASDLARG